MGQINTNKNYKAQSRPKFYLIIFQKRQGVIWASHNFLQNQKKI